MTSDVPVVRYLQTWLSAILLMETKFQHMSKMYFIMFEENLAFNPFFFFILQGKAKNVKMLAQGHTAKKQKRRY